MQDWQSRFDYDPAIPSCLRGKSSLRNPKGIIRGSFSEASPYYRVKFNDKMYMAHRVVWELFNGDIPEGYEVDHFDGDIYNNTLINLRCVTKQVNGKNKSRRTDNTTGHQGISLSTNNIGNQYYVFQWQLEDGTKKTKRFSCTKLGKNEALLNAIAFKDSISSLLVSQGYTKRHHNEC